jgi:hypothetical protein
VTFEDEVNGSDFGEAKATKNQVQNKRIVVFLRDNIQFDPNGRRPEHPHPVKAT